MWRWWLICGVVGCGRVGFDARGDAAVDAPFATGPFRAPVALVELNQPGVEDDVSMTGDLLEVYFMSDRDGMDHVFTATRGSTSETFGIPVVVPELMMGGAALNNPKVHPDGLSMTFARGGLGAVDLWEATRATRGSPWMPRLLAELSSTQDDYEPCMSEDRLAIYFTSNRSAMGDIYVATRASTSDLFANVTRVPELSSAVYDGAVFITDHGRTALWTSSNTIFQASRASIADPFGPRSTLAEADLAGNEQDGWLSPDGHTLLFVSDAGGNYDIYIATR